MNRVTGWTSCLLVAGAAFVGGCKHESGSSSEMKSMKKEEMAMKKAEMPATKPMEAAAPAMKEADMTHTIGMDCPMYTEMPMGADAKPMMMLKKDMKVMVMTPRGKYTVITTIGGMKGYVPTAALEPIGN